MEVLYEDNHIIAVYKRSSDLSQGDKTGDKPLEDEIKKYIARKYDKKGDVFLGVVHRLDRPVSGAMLFARTSKALERLNRMFSEGKIRKTYLAIVKERPPKDEDTLTSYLKKNENQNKTYVYDSEVKGSKKASLTYRLIARSDKFYLLEVELHTGRHHQIRAQLASIGCPIKGDLKYGFSRSNEDGGISLLSRKIEFLHPVKNEPVTIIAHFPEGDIWHHFPVQ
ncbi:MAG TPA: RluA family pseudouridine synthase [Bacteroidales bacterium]|nr:RluA family pseudouridine synthase [Bacteroidales bacterium]